MLLEPGPVVEAHTKVDFAAAAVFKLRFIELTFFVEDLAFIAQAPTSKCKTARFFRPFLIYEILNQAQGSTHPLTLKAALLESTKIVSEDFSEDLSGGT
jgi:hypothetical protein